MAKLAIDTKIQKWGNSLGLSVSGAIKDIPHFTENTPVKVEIFEDGFIVKKTLQPSDFLPFSEAQLLEEPDAFTSHGELPASPLESEIIE